MPTRVMLRDPEGEEEKTEDESQSQQSQSQLQSQQLPRYHHDQQQVDETTKRSRRLYRRRKQTMAWTARGDRRPDIWMGNPLRKKDLQFYIAIVFLLL
mmetsp:Transcript_29108/g.44727  ORF Transcript_29108/g.44727 Transcript_29108/m.44727 type:complete len:98 (-) Transcript_29108:24-317(-)